MEKSRIERINELTRLSRERALTDEEQQERTRLRGEYLAAVRANVEAQLGDTYIVESDGSQTKLPKKRD